ncbi:MAG: V-type ATP synthase subunit A, partial [Treponema sp.]|nr:V-type ATP synthase subunit A [Treponema sp.]
AFHGLSRERSDARKFPAIHPLDSWSKYKGIIDNTKVQYAHGFMRRGNEVEQMMKVVGEEGTSIEDYVIYLKGDLIDSVYFQQNSFDAVDAAVSPERQKHIFAILLTILASQFTFADKNEARTWFNRLRQKFLDYNGSEWNSERFIGLQKEIEAAVSERSEGLDKAAEKILI